jgi:hypothetical protein
LQVKEQAEKIWKQVEAATEEHKAREDSLREAKLRLSHLMQRRAELQSQVPLCMCALCCMVYCATACCRYYRVLNPALEQVAALREGPRAAVQLSPERAVSVAESGVDPDKLKTLQRSIADLLQSKPLEFSQLTLLADEFKAEAGRRVFAMSLKMLLHKKKSVEVSESAMELLLFLFNTCLVYMDLSKPSDFISGRVFVSAAHKIYRRDDVGGEDQVYNYIRDHELWRSVTFWEDHFW